MAGLNVERATKTFGSSLAVDGVDLSVESGGFVALLGPSGCGKTTFLRLIAGLERPSSGRIRIGERDMAADGVFVEPEDRGLGMVFQSYALWPHMNVWRNVEFGLKARHRPKPERRRRVAAALAMVGLADLGDRRPSDLSGGQRQRVALARCLALDPPLVLLDEPLASLDVHLRESMQREFRRLHRDSGTTFVYVTHDHAEALALADRVAVMDKGRLQQFAPPQELYRRPANAMVAAFIGEATLVPVDVLGVEPDGQRRIAIGRTRLALPGTAAPGPGLLCLRAADVELLPETAAASDAAIAGRVVECVYKGEAFSIDIALADDASAIVRAWAPQALERGASIRFAIRGGWALARDAAPT